MEPAASRKVPGEMNCPRTFRYIEENLNEHGHT